MNSIKLLKFFIFFLIFFKNSYGQNLDGLRMSNLPELYNIDSLEKDFNTIEKGTKYYLYKAICLVNSYDDVYKYRPENYIKEIDSLSQKYNYPFGVACALYWKAMNTLFNQRDYFQIKIELDSSLKIFRSLNDKSGLFWVNRAKLLLNEAINYALKNFNSFDQNSVPLFNENISNFDSSLIFNPPYDSMSVKEKILWLKYKSTSEYTAKYLDDPSMKNLYINAQNEAFQLIDQNPRYKFLKHYFYIEWGAILEMDKKYDSAIIYYKKYFAECYYKDLYKYLDSYLTIAACFRSMGKTDSSKYYYLQALKLCKDNSNNYSGLKKEIYNGLYEIEYENKNYEAAAKFLNLSILAQTQSQQNANLLPYIKMVQIQKFNQNELANKAEKEKRQRELNVIINKEKFTRFAFLSSLLFLALLGFLIYKININLKKIKLANADIKELNVARERFFAKVAHELRNPVSSFENFMDNIAHLIRQNKYEEVIQLSNEASIKSKNLSNVLNNLLFWSLTQQKKLIHKQEEVDLNKFFDEILPYYQTFIQQKNIHLVKTINASKTILVDKNRLAVINRNLLDNAIKYCDENGRITINIIQQNQYLEIAFSNTHQIINDVELKNIREILASRKEIEPDGGGISLGLVLIRQCLAIMNGKIEMGYKNEEVFFEVKIPFSKVN